MDYLSDNFIKTKALSLIRLLTCLIIMLMVYQLQCQAQLKGKSPDNSQPLARRIAGNPLNNLPKNIEVLTSFGERADFSPDNKHVAFMAKSFGDAMVIDIETRRITCLTCRIPAAAFLRVMHLVSGDYILIGPEKFENINVSRERDNELWFLSKRPGAKPIKLGVKMSEGMAVSKESMKIAFSQLHSQLPEIPEGASRLIVAEVDTS